MAQELSPPLSLVPTRSTNRRHGTLTGVLLALRNGRVVGLPDTPNVEADIAQLLQVDDVAAVEDERGLTNEGRARARE